MGEREEIYEAKKEGATSPGSVVPTTDAMSRLARSVEAIFQSAKDHRQTSGVDSSLAYAAESSRMQYSPEQIKTIRELGLNPENYPSYIPLFLFCYFPLFFLYSFHFLQYLFP